MLLRYAALAVGLLAFGQGTYDHLLGPQEAAWLESWSDITAAKALSSCCSSIARSRGPRRRPGGSIVPRPAPAGGRTEVVR